MSELTDRARAWAAEDPDHRTRDELLALVAAAEADPDGPAAADLADRFDGRLEFGTAGLRGALGAGPNRMNRAVVIRAAAGLAAYLRKQGAGRDATVVVGYDARHDSDVFAEDTAAVMVGAGLRAVLLPRPLPTPLLAYAIRSLGCVAGVMVTASHNPPQDNGYKVYLGDGSQIVPPADADISAAIDAVGALADVPRADGWGRLDDSVVESYLADVCALVDPDGPRELTTVYTPLHGVGGETVAVAMERAGFAAPHVARAQAEPDPDFPTVAFPNPEEPGAMDLAMALAAEVGADVVVANDPDADRCAVAVPDAHGWRMLRGDEVGALLGDFLLRCGTEGVYANSIVSSTLLGKLAAAHGQPHEETLTGFKWIGRVPRPGVRLRGGARLLRRAGPGPRQGRHLGAAAGRRARRPAQERGPHADRPARRDRPRARVARHRPALRAGHRPGRDRGRDGAAALGAAGRPGRARRRAGRRPRRGQRRAAAHRGPAVPAGRARPGDRAAVGHRAQDQVLPRGGGPGRPRRAGRGGRGADLRGRTPRRDPW